MSPVAAIKTVLFTKIFNYSGRASCSEFWWYVVFVAFILWLYDKLYIYIVPSFFVYQPRTSIWLDSTPHFEHYITFIFHMCLCIPFCSVTVRRLHDRNMVGWWGLLFAVIYFIYNNQLLYRLFPFWLDISNWVIYWVLSVIVVVLILSAYSLIPVLAKRGTIGPNRFGADPKAWQINTDVFS